MATAAKRITEIQKPTKGVKPNLNGVPGELVPAAGLTLNFAIGNRKVSPYDVLLDQLAAAPEGNLLRFAHWGQHAAEWRIR